MLGKPVRQGTESVLQMTGMVNPGSQSSILQGTECQEWIWPQSSLGLANTLIAPLWDPEARTQLNCTQTPIWWNCATVNLCCRKWLLCDAELTHSVVSDSATPWTVTCQAPLSIALLQARILEWVAMPSSRASSQPRDQTQISYMAGGFSTSWASREAQEYWSGKPNPSPGIFPTQELNWGLLHCSWILYQLSYQGSPVNGYLCGNSYATTKKLMMNTKNFKQALSFWGAPLLYHMITNYKCYKK